MDAGGGRSGGRGRCGVRNDRRRSDGPPLPRRGGHPVALGERRDVLPLLGKEKPYDREKNQERDGEVGERGAHRLR